MKTISLVSEDEAAKEWDKVSRWEMLFRVGELSEVDLDTLIILYRLFCGVDPAADEIEEYKSLAVAMVIRAILTAHLGVSLYSITSLEPLPFVYARE